MTGRARSLWGSPGVGELHPQLPLGSQDRGCVGVYIWMWIYTYLYIYVRIYWEGLGDRKPFACSATPGNIAVNNDIDMGTIVANGGGLLASQFHPICFIYRNTTALSRNHNLFRICGTLGIQRLSMKSPLFFCRKKILRARLGLRDYPAFLPWPLPDSGQTPIANVRFW